MPSQNEIRTSVTDQIVKSLQSGGLPPWRRRWNSDPNAAGVHTSLSTGNPYRGINQMILQVSAMQRGFQSRWWGTYGQIQQCGANVRGKEKGIHVILWKPIHRQRPDETGKEIDEKFLVMREFVVFNAEQTTGLDRFRIGFSKPKPVQAVAQRHEHADQLIEATNADIRYGGNQAFYKSTGDYIQVPHRHQFESPESFYETAFHELVHWTEPAHRLNWDRKTEGYAMGELIAEIGSCFLLADLEIPMAEQLPNSIAYLDHWLAGMQKDTRFIFSAAAQASKAVDYLKSFSVAATPTPVTV